MASTQSQDEASNQAAALIAATASKSEVSEKLILPKGTLKAQDANRIRRLAEINEGRSHANSSGSRKIPSNISINLTRGQVGDREKELLMKDLVLGFSKFFHKGGANLAPADSQYYSKTGMPITDWSLMRGARLCTAGGDEEEDQDEDENMKMASKHKRDDDDGMIHGEPRWLPNVGIRDCERPVRMDDAGRVDLQHDPYCLRMHFTTQWGVLKNQHVSDASQRGATVHWSDWEWILETEGEDAGLTADPNPATYLRNAYTKIIRLFDLISSPLLLYRIIANFAAPPCTENDWYKCAWTFTLWNRDDPTCRLDIYEHKGCPTVSFRGKERASTEALQLLEWLTGDNCPHPYDYTPCGRHA